jgi:ribosomal protein S18 acetylase RimI-like enzyme
VQALWRQIDELHATLAPGYFRPRGMATPSPGPDDADPYVITLVAAADGDGDGDGAGDGDGPPLRGAVLVRIYDTPADPTMVPRRRAHIEALVVDRLHRRAGIGTALMDAAAAWARERGAAEVVLTVWAGNVAAEAFYERLGYGVVSRALAKPI